MNRRLVGTSRREVPARAVAGGTLAPLNAARTSRACGSAVPAFVRSWSQCAILGLQLLTLALVLALCGCASSRAKTSPFTRPFVFGEDTFAYANELYWVYKIDPETGSMTHEWRKPKPEYAQHCFVMARSARQFFQHARFDTNEPAMDEKSYRKLIRKIVSIDPRHELEPEKKIVVPGYPNLHAFSQAQETALKLECGVALESYFQRGHWRMIWHFSKKNQSRMAQQLIESIRSNRPPVVHVAHFPKLQINHALLLFDVKETEKEIEFATYDPNFPECPTQLFFRKNESRFYYPPQSYFPGGLVDVYEIYYRWNY
jgi:hypothetical protein